MIKNFSLIKILALGILLRLAIIVLSTHFTNYDQNSYRLIGEMTLQGKNIFPLPAAEHYPYLPFFLYLEALAIFLNRFGIDSIFFLKNFFSLFDLGIVFLLSKLADDKTALLYAINPVAILVACFQGQFDAIPLFFLLLAVYFYNRKNQNAGMAVFSLAVLVKTWPLVFIIPFVRRSQKKLAWVVFLLLPLVFVIFYVFYFHTDFNAVFQTVRSYRGTYENWGIGKWIITYIFHSDENAKNIFRKIFFICFFAYSLTNRQKNLSRSLTTLLLFFFAFTPTFGIQWLVWPIPFLLMTKPDRWQRLLSLITIYVIANYFSWIYPVGNRWFFLLNQLLSLAAWGGFVWFFVKLKWKGKIH